MKVLYLPWNKMSNIFTVLGYKQIGQDLCLSKHLVIKEIGLAHVLVFTSLFSSQGDLCFQRREKILLPEPIASGIIS